MLYQDDDLTIWDCDSIRKTFFYQVFLTHNPNLNTKIEDLFLSIILKEQNQYFASIPSLTERKHYGTCIFLKLLNKMVFLSFFTKKSWPIIRDHVISKIQKFLITGVLQPSQNHTFISLISKVNIPQCVSDYRPIILYNMSYKIIVQILVKKLRIHLKDHISPYQTAFLQGR